LHLASVPKAKAAKPPASSKQNAVAIAKEAQLNQMRVVEATSSSETPSNQVRMVQRAEHEPPKKSRRTSTEKQLATFEDLLESGTPEETRAFVEGAETSIALKRGAAAAPGELGMAWGGTVVAYQRPPEAVTPSGVGPPEIQPHTVDNPDTAVTTVITEVPPTPTTVKPRAANPLTPTTAIEPSSSFD
jgi:hypothetical protein